ncbi:MAG TPA: hypothetical protein GXZ29_01420 [Clostridiales bacterium]|nr:hypothetical protein [Clostridiales bacterium]
MIRTAECIMCCLPKRENLILLGRNICKECEQKLMKCDAGDECYPFYLEKMKNIIKPAYYKETGIR